jgi:site-specific recombinase XerD
MQGSRAYYNFINSLKSEETKAVYKKCLGYYLLHYNHIIKRVDDLVTLPVTESEKMLVDYLLGLKHDNLSSSYINLHFCAIKHFYFMNDVRINKEKIGKFLGEPKKKNVDRGYTHEEIKQLLDVADLRMKVVITVLASTGMRIGGFARLKLSHVKKIPEYGIYKFTVYENTNEECFPFCTPECTGYIDSYFEYRKRCGEQLTDDSYFIREQFDVNDFEQIRKHGRQISQDTITTILRSLTVRTGIRQINHQYTRRERTKIPVAHGFRKFWTTTVIHAGINPEIRELLLGRKIGLAGAYYRPTETDMIEEFIKCINDLTINPENRLRIKVAKLEVEKSQIEALAYELEQVKKALTLK